MASGLTRTLRLGARPLRRLVADRPKRLGELFSDPDAARAGRAMQAMLKMRKLDIATLECAADG